MTRFVALLRALNVGGRKLSMDDLRAVVQSLNFTDVQTYIQSGNVVFSGVGTTSTSEERLEKAIKERFGIEVPTLVRTASQWQSYLEPPFSSEELSSPNHVLLGLCKDEPNASAAEVLAKRATYDECIKMDGNAIWLYFPNGIGQSKLTPALIDKATGSATTLRNLNTVRKLAQMCGIRDLAREKSVER
jgi:uncharacterized protein (DUF1697 family)